MTEPDFTSIIAAAKAAREKDAQVVLDAKRDESQRQQLNFKVVEEKLRAVVLPVFRKAADQLQVAGCFVDVTEVRSQLGHNLAMVLVASLKAGHLASRPPQTYVELRYEGDPQNLAFTIKLSDKLVTAMLDDITPENVTANVAEMLRQMP